MKILFMTNYPAPYRVDFFNELGNHCDLTVAFEEMPEQQTHRDPNWFNTNYDNFSAAFLKPAVYHKKHPMFSLQILSEIKKGYDVIIVGVYSTFTSMIAIQYMISKHIPFYIETDGGSAKDGKGFVEKLKKHLIKHAVGYFSPSSGADEYLVFYGANRDKIYRYPFTSLQQSDLLEQPLTRAQKKIYKDRLGMPYDSVFLGVGQLIHRKGWDLLIKVAAQFPNVGFYIIGGHTSEEYEQLRKAVAANNVHFVEFKKKEALKEYYYAADFSVLPTRSDFWGLVINEALAYALPTITTRACVAGVDMIENGKNGYLVNVNSENELVDAISHLLGADNAYEQMQVNALNTAKEYTIENMVQAHICALHLNVQH